MQNPENDNNLAPHEEVERDFDAGEIAFEDAVVKMLSLINEAAWCLVIDLDKLVSMESAKRETKH